MTKRRVALLCAQQLLGESLERVLVQFEDVQLLGPWIINDKTFHQITADRPDIVVIAEEVGCHDQVSVLTSHILEAIPDLPVIRCTLEENLVRVFSAQWMPASSADLIEAIRNWPIHPQGETRSKNERKQSSPPTDEEPGGTQ
jgi:hypothetical protein